MKFLFLLHPEDEMDQVRSLFGLKEKKTYFKHTNTGVERASHLSIGLVFRTCVTSSRVWAHTGQLVVEQTTKPRVFNSNTGKLVRDMDKAKDRALSKYCMGGKVNRKRKEETEQYVQKKYLRMEHKHKKKKA